MNRYIYLYIHILIYILVYIHALMYYICIDMYEFQRQYCVLCEAPLQRPVLHRICTHMTIQSGTQIETANNI